MLETAKRYLDAGLCVLPAIRTQKRPAVHTWKEYQNKLPDEDTVNAWFSRKHDGVCLLAGKSSGNLELIDFDQGGESFDPWSCKIPLELLDRLVIETSQSGGRHVVYRCEDKIGSSMKLARRTGDDGGPVTLIETRGDGGLFLCAPTDGYEPVQGDLANLPLLTSQERELLLQAAWEFNEYRTSSANCPKMSADVGQTDELSADNGGLSADNSNNGSCSSDNGHNSPMSADNSHMCDYSSDNGHGANISLLDRAKLYLDACDPAISGQGGHNQTFFAAQALVNGFCLEPEAALRLLQENYNPRCEPPWTEKELRHKVDSALKSPSDKPRGWIRDEEFEVQEGLAKVDISGIVEETQKPTSLVVVPDEQSDRAYEFIDATLFEPCPPDWLLHGTLERDTLALVFGDPGCGKTFMAFDWAARIATGTPWRGHEVKTAPVFYVAGEGRRGLGRRIRAWEQHNGVKIAKGSLFIGPAVAVTDGRQLSELIAAIDTQKKPGLIVLDTLARCFGGGDENSTQDMSRFVAACDLLRRYYGCTILIVHHTGHADKNRARGAMALNAALDAEYRLNRSNSGLILTATKMKDADPPTPLGMNLLTVDLPGMKDDYGNPVTSAAIEVVDADIGALVSTATTKCEQERTEKHCRQIIEVLKASPEAVSKKKIRELAGLNSDKVQGGIDVLLSQDRIHECELMHRGNKKVINGYRLTDKTSSHKSALCHSTEDVVDGGV